MAIPKIHRRTVLRGLGGLALALPALEIMGGSRAAADIGTVPKRYVFMYGGISTGTYSGSSHADMIVPATVGPGYEITPSLQPVEDFAVQPDVSVVSGLKLPWQTTGDVPPGGRPALFHYATVAPQISGVRTLDRSEAPGGPTSDQIVADAIAGDTLNRVLNYRVQPVNYDGGNGDGGNTGRLSWYKAPNGDIVAVDPTVSPQLAHQSLFGNFVPTDPAEQKKAEFLLRRRKSALDLVHGHIEKLMPQLGKADQIRMERHFDEVRALEKRLAAIDPGSGGACMLPTAPGEDPPVGGAIVGDGQAYSDNAGYSSEDLRAELLCDYIYMAFVCDLSRVASLQLTMWKCYMNMFEIAGWQSDMHELTHGAGPLESVSDSVKWHVKHFARLASKLKSVKDIDGTTLLDNSALVLTFEGGHGYDPEGGNDNSPHSTENMTMLVAGHAGKLAGGLHVKAPDKHPCSVTLTAMNAVGVPGGLGEVTGDIPELYG